MTDTVDPSGQQTQVPGQQAQTTTVPPTEDWKKRYDGQVRAIEQLVAEKRALEAELATLRTQVEQLNAQLSVKDVEKTAAVGERDNQIKTFAQQVAEKDAEIRRLKALELKVQVANELGNPSLLKIATTIPDVDDPEALKTIMKNMNDFVAQQVKAREDQLLAGVVPAGGVVTTTSSTPNSEEAWKRHIEEIPFSDPAKRRRALDDYGRWLQEKHTQGR